MDVILISLAICVLGVMVTVLLFALAMEARQEEAESPAARPLPQASEGFFLEEGSGAAEGSEEPTNALLLQLENHVRREQAAAESFLQGPSVDTLHAPSDSPFWN